MIAIEKVDRRPALSIGDMFGGMDPDILLQQNGDIDVIRKDGDKDEILFHVSPDPAVYFAMVSWAMSSWESFNHDGGRSE